LTLSLKEQEEYVRRVGEKAFARTLRFMKDHKAEIIEMMAEGIREGYEQYGDSSWHLPHAALDLDQKQELRDACNRQAMKMRQGWPK
jgi:hypothetical protein